MFRSANTWNPCCSFASEPHEPHYQAHAAQLVFRHRERQILGIVRHALESILVVVDALHHDALVCIQHMHLAPLDETRIGHHTAGELVTAFDLRLHAVAFHQDGEVVVRQLLDDRIALVGDIDLLGELSRRCRLVDTRPRLVGVAQDVIVREDDCGTEEGLTVTDIKDENYILEPLAERLEGRYLLHDAIDPNTGEVIWSHEDMVTGEGAKKIVDAGITSIEIRSVLTCHSHHGVCKKCYGRNLATSKPVTTGEAVGIVAAQSIGEPGTQLTMRTFHTGGIASTEDITQGLPRVEELFEARRPKRCALIAKMDGTVRIAEEKKSNVIIITNDELKTEEKVTIPYGIRCLVKDGDEVKAGDMLIPGAKYPQDILEAQGPEAVEEYIIAEIQNAYRTQGVDINDKHIEVIVRQMMRKLRITDPGSTDLLQNVSYEYKEIAEANAAVQARIDAGEEGLSKAAYRATLLGITKASLATESFLSAASFQETTRVLTEAAIKGKVDPLFGLKENVIIGKLVPAGTGMRCAEINPPEYDEDMLDDGIPTDSEAGDMPEAAAE